MMREAANLLHRFLEIPCFPCRMGKENTLSPAIQRKGERERGKHPHAPSQYCMTKTFWICTHMKSLSLKGTPVHDTEVDHNLANFCSVCTSSSLGLYIHEREFSHIQSELHLSEHLPKYGQIISVQVLVTVKNQNWGKMILVGAYCLKHGLQKFLFCKAGQYQHG